MGASFVCKGQNNGGYVPYFLEILLHVEYCCLRNYAALFSGWIPINAAHEMSPQWYRVNQVQSSEYVQALPLKRFRGQRRNRNTNR